MPYEPIVPKGQHLGTSREVDGAVTGHLFDNGTNELRGHAAWRLVDDSEEDYSSCDDSYSYDDEPSHELTPEERELAEQIAALILAGIVLAVTEAAPHVRRWWNEKAVPRVKSAWKRIPLPRKANSQVATTTSDSVTPPRFVASATGVEIAVLKSKVSMSSSEWEHRFRAMLAAGAFKDEQLRILSDARIEDGDGVLEAQSAMEQLTPRQFADRITLMLEANPSLLDNDTSAELMRVFSTRLRPKGRGSRELEK